MAENTEISWTDSTQSWWIGCTAISDACTHCYAEALNKRTGGDNWGNKPRRRTSVQNWNNPLRWQRKAGEFFAQHGRRRRVFVSSMSDFYDNQVDPQWRADAWDVIRQCPDLDWLILTKRPQNIRKMLPPFWDEIKDRIWSGTTVEDQPRAETNIPHILRIDSRYRFISAEPLLGPLFLREIKVGVEPTRYLDALTGSIYSISGYDGMRLTHDYAPHKLDWVITGGESGHGARPMHINWPRVIRDDCEMAGVAFHWKQWGSHIPDWMDPAWQENTPPSGELLSRRFLVNPWAHTGEPTGGPPPHYVIRTKAKVAGLLDGKTHKAFPV